MELRFFLYARNIYTKKCLINDTLLRSIDKILIGTTNIKLKFPLLPGQSRDDELMNLTTMQMI